MSMATTEEVSMEAPQATDKVERVDWRQYFDAEELSELTRMEDWKSWRTLLFNWGVVFLCFWLVAAWPNPLTILLGLFLIGARQLGMAVLMHEASHYTLLSDKRWNDWVGNWLCAYPIWGDVLPYRPYHLQHHAHNWTRKDPDLGLATPFPITRESLWRKVWRDLSGQTGWKRARATVRRDLGASLGKVQAKDAGWERLRGVVITNGVLLAILTALGHPALYLLWPAAWLTTYSLVMRIRAIAEHSLATDPANPFQNSRTTRASWWERLFIAPNGVNYHLEHHLAMRVPAYNLRRMHETLRARGALANALVAESYLEVLRAASSKQARAAA